jgi:hypothetical protein
LFTKKNAIPCLPSFLLRQSYLPSSYMPG